MRRTTFDERRDQSIAADTFDARDNLCSAHGCPNMWSVLSTKLCRWHADSPAHLWPQVTQEAHDAITDQARANATPRLVAPPLSRADKTAILQKMRLAVARARLA